jgi:hypothetical protein
LKVPTDYPQIVDKSTLTGVFQGDQFLTIGVEGQKDAAGSASVAIPQRVSDPAQADALFGPVSNLAKLVKVLLNRGMNYVIAVASASGVAPTLAQRQTAWATLEEDSTIRLRLTFSTTQAELVALARSVEYAENIQNKQFAVVGMPAGTTKTALNAAGDAMLSKRAIMVGPTLFDLNGAVLDGMYAAAYVATMIAQNPDIMDSLNNAEVPGTTGIEKEAATGLPLFRLRSNGGVPINDFQDLEDHGISPFQQAPSGLAALTHLRMTYKTDTTFDALTTLLVKDTLFLEIRDMLTDAKFLRKGNTPSNRALAGKMVDQYLRDHSDWVLPVALGDGTTGYGVTVVPSADQKSFTINYFGQVVRGTNVININGSLTIPA